MKNVKGISTLWNFGANVHFSILGDTWMQDRVKAAASFPLKSYNYCFAHCFETSCLCFRSLQSVQFQILIHPIRVVGSIPMATEQLEEVKHRDQPTSSRWPRRPGAELWTEKRCTDCHDSALAVRESWNPQLIPGFLCSHKFTYIYIYKHTKTYPVHGKVNLIILNVKRGTITPNGFLKSIN